MEKLKEQIQSIVDIYKSGNLLEAEFLTGQLINNNPKVVFLYNQHKMLIFSYYNYSIHIRNMTY